MSPIAPDLETIAAGIAELERSILRVEDLQLLYGLVRHLRPKLVLETRLGFGHATAAVALGLKSNGVGCVWTLETNQERARATRALWSSLGLASAISLVPSNLQDFVRDYSVRYFDLVLAESVEEVGLLRGRIDGHVLVRGEAPNGVRLAGFTLLEARS